MNVAAWLDRDEVASRLSTAGMGRDCAEHTARNFIEAAAELNSMAIGPDAEIIAAWVPGRIEVFGKHTDYCGGESILAAAERGFCMLAAPTPDDLVRVVDARRNDHVEFSMRDDLSPTIGHWSNYPQTVARRLGRNFPQARRGATIAFSSNLPPSSGMSSSSAFVVGSFFMLSATNNLEQDATYAQVIRTPEDLAGYVSTIENGLSFGPFAGNKGVGTFGGSEDHTAILCGQADRLTQYSYCPIRFRRSISLAEQYIFAIASSGVAAEKTGAALDKYNRVSALARAIVEKWQLATKRGEASLAAILDSAPDEGDQLRDMLKDSHSLHGTQALIERLDHFVCESQLIRSVPDSIGAGTIGQFSDAAQQSHEAAVKLLKNQTPETIELAAIADRLGAHGASAFGAGFGGSVWALVERASAESFLVEWQAAYTAKFPHAVGRAEFFSMRPGMHAVLWNTNHVGKIAR